MVALALLEAREELAEVDGAAVVGVQGMLKTLAPGTGSGREPQTPAARSTSRVCSASFCPLRLRRNTVVDRQKAGTEFF